MLVPKSEKVARVIITIFLIMLALLCVVPMVYELAVSLSKNDYVTAGKVTFWPVGFTLNSYSYVLSYKSFWNSMLISFIRLGLTWVISMVVTVLTAYPLAHSKDRLFGRNVIAWYFFIPMIFNGGLIPTYMVINTLGLLGTIWALVLPAIVVTFHVLLVMNFIRSLPGELEEAAMIDGANPLQILVRVILPVLTPCLATITVYISLGTWNEWFNGIIYMNKPTQYPLMSYLRSTVLIQNASDLSPEEQQRLASIGNETFQAAQLFIATVPMLIIYPFLQKYFTQGLVLGSVKG